MPASSRLTKLLARAPPPAPPPDPPKSAKKTKKAKKPKKATSRPSGPNCLVQLTSDVDLMDVFTPLLTTRELGALACASRSFAATVGPQVDRRERPRLWTELRRWIGPGGSNLLPGALLVYTMCLARPLHLPSPTHARLYQNLWKVSKTAKTAIDKP